MIDGTIELITRQLREFAEFRKTHDLVWEDNVGRWLPRKED